MQRISSLFGGKDNKELSRAVKMGAMLVDVRSPEEFEAGSVPGAVNIPLSDLHRRLDLLKNKKDIIVFCRSGSRSAMARNTLRQYGISNVIDGGSWQHVDTALRH